MAYLKDMAGIQTRATRDGVARYRGRVKDRGKWVPGPWRTSLADARGDRTRLQARKLDGPLSLSRSQTLADASERFLAAAEQGVILSRRRQPYGAKTVRGYRQAFEDWILPELGHVEIDKLRRSQVQRWVDWMLSQRDAGTVRNAWSALAALYRWYLPRSDNDGVPNPTRDVQLPAPSAPRERYASPEEMSALLAALTPELALPYALAFYAGLRHAEIQAFRWEDVEGEWVIIRRSLDPTDGFKLPKSGKPRQVPVFASLVPHLIPGTSGWVVPAKRTSQWGVQMLGRSHAAKCEKRWAAAGLEPIGLHEGRHSFVTALVRAGYDIKLVQQWAGHADPSTTLRIYAKERGREAGAADLMNTYLDPGGPPSDPTDLPIGQGLSPLGQGQDRASSGKNPC